MPVHNVVQGETIISIADKYGVSWETVWNAGENARLKQEREDPSILFPGDQVVIPETTPGSVAAAMGGRHRYRLKKQTALFRVKVEDAAGQPLPGKKFLLEIETLRHEGVTDEGAVVELEIPAAARSGKLIVWLEDEKNTVLSWNLKLGHLDPVETVTGVQARLSNLGFPVGEISGQMGTATEAAIRAFQIVHGLPADGQLSDAVRQKLEELHDRSGG